METFWTRSFPHGVHPPQCKDATAGESIRQFPFAPVLVVSLAQHLGKAAVPVVSEGEKVERGQLIGRPQGELSAALHAPASGVVRRIALGPSVRGTPQPSIYLEPSPGCTQQVAEGQPCDVELASPEDILQAIGAAGIVGLGGAAFPTHVKLRLPPGGRIDTVIVNGAECEPYLTTDHRVMLEQTSDIVVGLRYLLRATGAARVIVGVEANKPDALQALREAVPQSAPVRVESLEAKYPQGAEKLLIRALLGVEVPSGGLPRDVGVVCINVATVAEIGRLLPHGRGVQERVITVTGPVVKDPGNYRIAIGTPLRFILETVGTWSAPRGVLLGGPMMGAAVASLDVPIVKGTSGVLAFGASDGPGIDPLSEYPCIRCARCLEACPLSLHPADLAAHARKGKYLEMAEQLHLMDCFECGSCSYVCPSHIPLVQHFQAAKGIVRRARQRKRTEGIT